MLYLQAFIVSFLVLVVALPAGPVAGGVVLVQTITNCPVRSLRYAIIAAPRTPWSR